MGLLQSTNVIQNEILKATDVNGGFDASIENISKVVQCLFESDKDFVIGESELLKYHSLLENDWSLTLEPIVGLCKDTGVLFLNNESQIVAVKQPENNVARRDIIEIQGSMITTDPQQRSFIDFDTKASSLIKVDTKKVLSVKVRCKSTDEIGSIEPPSHSEGWVKLAEIDIPGDATKISDCTIYNITSDVASALNPDWHQEKGATYNIGCVSNISSAFRVAHEKNGQHKADSINSTHIDFGTEENKVNSSVIPTGDIISIDGEEKGATTSVLDLLKIVAQKLTNLFNNYMKNGALNFNGEISISDTVQNKTLVNAIKIGATGDGSAYIKIANKEIIKITQSGNNFSITAGNGYTANNDYDFVCKKDVYNAIVKDEIPTENSNNLVKSGGVYSSIKSVSDQLPNFVEKTKIEQTITESTENIPSSNALLNKLKGYTKKWVGTQAQYDEIQEKDPDTFYCITDGINTLIDDTTASDEKTYSSNKINSELANYVYNNKTNSTITDCNNCPIGFVSMPGNANNSPSTARTYVLTQFYNNNQNYKSQVATVLNSTDMFIRFYNNGTWGTWKKIATTSDLPSGGTAGQVWTSNGTSAPSWKDAGDKNAVTKTSTETQTITKDGDDAIVLGLKTELDQMGVFMKMESPTENNLLGFMDGELCATDPNSNIKPIAYKDDISKDVTVTTTGSGNAITSITASGNDITATKGSTFLTSHQSFNTLIGTLSEGTSDVTDGTMFVSSYASDNGFADTNAKNTPYKRTFLHVFNYIKSKLKASDIGALASDGVASSASSVRDYNSTSTPISIGYSGSSLTADNTTYLAGYSTSGGTKIKDVSWDAVKSKLGMSNFVTTDTTQTITGSKSFLGSINAYRGTPTGTFTTFTAGGSYDTSNGTTASITLNGGNTIFGDQTDRSGSKGYWRRNNYDIVHPNKAGTIALISDIPPISSFVQTSGNQTIEGTKTFTGEVVLPTTEGTTVGSIWISGE